MEIHISNSCVFWYNYHLSEVLSVCLYICFLACLSSSKRSQESTIVLSPSWVPSHHLITTHHPITSLSSPIHITTTAIHHLHSYTHHRLSTHHPHHPIAIHHYQSPHHQLLASTTNPSPPIVTHPPSAPTSQTMGSGTIRIKNGLVSFNARVRVATGATGALLAYKLRRRGHESAFGPSPENLHYWHLHRYDTIQLLFTAPRR